jgi:hypothetical protein
VGRGGDLLRRRRRRLGRRRDLLRPGGRRLRDGRDLVRADRDRADPLPDVLDRLADPEERVARPVDDGNALVVRPAAPSTTDTARRVSPWISAISSEMDDAARSDSSASFRTRGSSLGAIAAARAEPLAAAAVVAPVVAEVPATTAASASWMCFAAPP